MEPPKVIRSSASDAELSADDDDSCPSSRPQAPERSHELAFYCMHPAIIADAATGDFACGSLI